MSCDVEVRAHTIGFRDASHGASDGDGVFTGGGEIHGGVHLIGILLEGWKRKRRGA